MRRHLLTVLALTALLVASGAIVSVIWREAAPDAYALPATTAAPEPAAEADLTGTTGAITLVPSKPGDPPGYTRIPKPAVPDGPRRVGIQVGHWQTENVPPELRILEVQTGTSWNGIKEVDVSLDVATRVKAILEAKGIAVDLLPTATPPGYLADVFVALHSDGDGVGTNSGYKLAHSSRRTPYEDRLLQDLKEEYGAATGLGYDAQGISRGMINLYSFVWFRYRSATSPFTPSVILEMGYLSNDGDRELLTGHSDVVAAGIANGIERFLGEVPSTQLFGEDLLVPPFRPFASPLASPRP